MISKKIHQSKIIDLTNQELPFHNLLAIIAEVGEDRICNEVVDLDKFDKFVLKYFFTGISG